MNALNNTARSNQRILFFNRVPKAGTSSVAAWLQLLSERNDFDHYSYRIVDGLDSEINSMDRK